MTQLAEDLEDSPYYFKRKGKFEYALKEYISVFASSQEQGNHFVSETCFDQIFDISLLMYVKQGREFPNAQNLKAELKRDLLKALSTEGAGRLDGFEKLFDSCWRRFSPRGGGRIRFSVGRQALVPKERTGEQTSSE